MTSSTEKGIRKFRLPEAYLTSQNNEYYLLPFRFHRTANGKEIIVNEFGDYLIKPEGTVERIVGRKIQRSTDTDLYGDLLSHFIISESVLPAMMDVMATRYRTKKSFLDGFTSLHIFVMSLRCEHTCHYCQVSRVTQDKTTFDITEAHLDKAIDLMMKSPNPNVTMEFQGGEPLLVFDKIIYAVQRAKTLAAQSEKSLTIVICTNLALINDEVLDFCAEHRILISTSIDGPDYIHNKNRKRPGQDSYTLAVSGIERSRLRLGHDQISALMTTSNLSLDYPEAIVDEYFKLGFRNIFLRPISPYGFATRSDEKNKYVTQRFLDFYKKALGHILEYNLRGEYYREDYASILLKKILTPFPTRYVDLQSPAGLVTGVVVFNYNGEVYASDEARMLAEMHDKTFLLGHLDHNSYEEIFYSEKAKMFITNGINEILPGCSQCAFQQYCGADPVYHHATQGNMVGYRPTSGFCTRNMELITYLIDLMDSEPEIEKIFRSWIYKN